MNRQFHVRRVKLLIKKGLRPVQQRFIQTVAKEETQLFLNFSRNRACWAAQEVRKEQLGRKLNGYELESLKKEWFSSESSHQSVEEVDGISSEFELAELVHALRLHCTPDSSPTEVLRITRNFLKLVKCADYIDQRDLRDKLRHYAIQMCDKEIKPQDVALQVENELASYDDGVEQFTQFQERMHKMQQGQKVRELENTIQHWAEKIRVECQTILEGDSNVKSTQKFERQLMSLVDINTAPVVAIRELLSLFGRPKEGWRGKEDLPQSVACYATRAIQSIGKQLSDHSRIQCMKSQFLNHGDPHVLQHFPSALWNRLNYQGAGVIYTGQFINRCARLGIPGVGREVFYEISGGKEELTFEELEEWILKNKQSKFYRDAYDTLVASRIKKYTLKSSETFVDSKTRHQVAASLGFDLTSYWPQDATLKLGALFLNAMYKHCTLFDGNEDVPVLKETVVIKGTNTHYEVEAQPLLIDMLSQSAHVKATGMLDPVHRPMVVPPRRWTVLGSGPYFLYDQPIMRAIDKRGQMELVKMGKMDKLLRGLNATQETPWKLDHRIIDVMNYWYTEKGGGVAKLPYRDDVPDVVPEDDWSMRKRIYLQTKVKKANAERFSLRSDFNLRVDMARHYQDTSALYFPQNFDFRGRIYPIPPHLNHIGSDVCRGMMKFAEKKKLGDKGWYWLKVNLANKFGFDKAPNDDRAKWAEDRLDKVRACAADVYNNHWYMEADDPWQALANILEVNDALESGDPREFYSGLPVAQDGSCNGLQHYAALTRDPDLATYVNLRASDVRGDIYEVVRQHVEQTVQDPEKRIFNGRDFTPEVEMMKNHITRKLVKTTVMTSVYGVTPYGAKRQIQDAMKEMIQKGQLHLPEPSEENEFKDWKKSISTFFGQITYTSMSEVTCSAYLTMLWLRDCARKVAERGHRVTWLTPLNLPCMQHYARIKQNSVKTASHSILVEDSFTNQIAVGKQVSGIAPNFVHSLDSTHCLMTAEACRYEKNIEFASVHDSFWTHACDVDTLNQVIREQFLELHQENLLEVQYRRWATQYPNIDFPPPPEVSTFELDEVLRSQFFFS